MGIREGKSSVLPRGRLASRGFTLLEVIVAMIASSVLAVAVAPFFRANLRSYMSVRLAKDSLQSARIGFNRLAAEIRRVQTPGDITYASPSTFEFIYLNPDGTQEWVQYYYSSSSGQLRRSRGGVTTRLIEGVSACNFKYYNASGASFSPGGSTYPNIRRVRLSLTLGAEDQTYTLWQDICLQGFGTY